MKKLVLLLAVGVLAACGGGTKTQDTVSTDSGNLPLAKLTVGVDSGKFQGKTLGLGAYANASTASNKIRIVISNQNLKVKGVAFKNISTYPLPLPVGLTIKYSLPVAAGYKIEAFSYTARTGLNLLKKYATDTFDIALGTGNANITLAPAGINPTLAFAIYSTNHPLGAMTTYATALASYTNKYNINVTGKSAPLASTWTLVESTAPISGLTSKADYAALPNTTTAGLAHGVADFTVSGRSVPQGYDAGTLYILGLFYLDPFYLKSDETSTSFIYNAPYGHWGDAQVSQSYLAAPVGTTGTINPASGTP